MSAFITVPPFSSAGRSAGRAARCYGGGLSCIWQSGDAVSSVAVCRSQGDERLTGGTGRKTEAVPSESQVIHYLRVVNVRNLSAGARAGAVSVVDNVLSPALQIRWRLGADLGIRVPMLCEISAVIRMSYDGVVIY